MAGPIRIALLANGAQARREMQITAASGQRSFGVLGRAGRLATLGLTAGAVGFAKSAVDLEKKYSTSMRLIQAATGATGNEVNQLNDLAIKLGADTSFSAAEAADSMLELAKAGLDTKTILGGGLAGTLQLAAAGGTELGTAATIASNAMNAFSLEGKDMASVAAALAGGANASTASVESLGQGLAQVGPGATNAGLSLQETVAALSAFDAAGIKGSDAGTSLKTMLARLVPSTDKARNAMERLGLKYTDAQGRFLPLTEIAQRTQDAFKGLSEEQRTAALTTIFGSDATRAATVLMKEGGGGIRDFIKATQDQEAAQKLAAARMSGTEGALERLSGAAETAKLRLGQELAPAVVRVADYVGPRLVPAIETAVDGAKDLADAVEPAARSLVDLLPSAKGAGDVFNDVLVPALSVASDVVSTVADAFGDLPGPLQTLAVSTGIAAVALPRLTASLMGSTVGLRANVVALTQWGRAALAAETRATAFGLAGLKLKDAARTAGGPAGLGLLTVAATQSNDGMSILLGTLGGAALGFSLGGPIGALIGGAGGGLLGVFQASKKASSGAETMVDRYKDLRGTLNEVTGATTAATRAYVYDELVRQKALDGLAAEGISRRTAIDAVLGERDARLEVSAALKRQEQDYATSSQKLKDLNQEFRILTQGDATYSGKKLDALLAEIDATTALNDQQKNAIEGIRSGILKVREDTRAQRERADAINDYGALLDGVRNKGAIVSYLEVAGVPRGIKDVGRMQRTLNLTPKRLTTVLEALGIEVNRRKLRQLNEDFRSIDRTTVTFPKVKSGVAKSIADVELSGQRGMRRLTDVIAKETRKARTDLGPAKTALNTQLTGLTGQAGRGGTTIGSSLQSGFGSGFGGAIAAWSSQVRAAVNAAINAGKAEAKSNSPSRRTMELGRDLGDGLIMGLAAKEKDAKGGGRSIVAQLLAGVTGGGDAIDSALDKVTELIEKRIKAKDPKVERAREKAALKALKDEYQALRQNGKLQDALQDGNYLAHLRKGSQLYERMTALGVKNISEARDKLRELQDQSRAYRETIKQSFIATANVTQLGQLDDGTVSTGGLLSELRDKLIRAQRFTSLISSLRGKLNATSLQQLLDAGPDAGLATAEAIAAGGSAAISEINTLTSQITSLGQGLGGTMADQFYGAGIQAAQGLIKGLESEEARLDKVSKKLANALVAAIKKQLGIKSPSTVFRDLGTQSVRGLGLGLDEVYVRRQGQRVATSLQEGFGRPALEAYMSAPRDFAGGPVRVEVAVRLTADQVSDLEHGREITVTGNAFVGAGGRRFATGGS